MEEVKRQNDAFAEQSHDSRVQCKDAERFFSCEFCLVWFSGIDDILIHIEEQHEKIEVSLETQTELYNRWDEILKIEKVIMALIDEGRFKSAKRLMKVLLNSYNAVHTNVFSPGDNIFKHFIAATRTRVKSLIKDSKQRVKSTKKRKRKLSNADDFSSDDDICLKEKAIQIKSHGDFKPKIVERSSNATLVRNVYYVVPEKENGDFLNYFEINHFKRCMKDIIKKREVDLNQFEHIVVKRFNLEPDEIIPHNAIAVSEWALPTDKTDEWESRTAYEFLHKNISKSNRNTKCKVKKLTLPNENGNLS